VELHEKLREKVAGLSEELPEALKANEGQEKGARFSEPSNMIVIYGLDDWARVMVVGL
jgi:hypothetical protein